MDNLPATIDFTLKYVDSLNAMELDSGIRETIKGIKVSALAVGYALVRIKKEKSYVEQYHRKFSEYLEDLCLDAHISRSTIYTWLMAGKVYDKYKDDLNNLGFSELDGYTKLPYLERALMLGDKEEVLDKFISMNYQEFIDFVKSAKNEAKGEVPYWEDRGNVFLQKGKRAVIINSSLDKRSLNALKSANRAALKALEKNGYLLMVHLKSPEELRRFRKIAKRARDKMREKAAGKKTARKPNTRRVNTR